MANNPAFITAVNNGSALFGGTNTARDGTGSNIATIFTAGSSGSQLFEIHIKGNGDTAQGVITIFLYDGSSYFLYDEVYMQDLPTGSATVIAGRIVREYSNCIIKSGWSVRAGMMVAPTAGSMYIHAFGGDF